MNPEQVRRELIAAIEKEAVYIQGFRDISKTETARVAIDFELMGIKCAILAVRECELKDDT